MEAYDALEKRTVQELSYDELTAEQTDAKDKRLQEVRIIDRAKDIRQTDICTAPQCCSYPQRLDHPPLV